LSLEGENIGGGGLKDRLERGLDPKNELVESRKDQEGGEKASAGGHDETASLTQADARVALNWRTRLPLEPRQAWGDSLRSGGIGLKEKESQAHSHDLPWFLAMLRRRSQEGGGHPKN